MPQKLRKLAMEWDYTVAQSELIIPKHKKLTTQLQGTTWENLVEEEDLQADTTEEIDMKDVVAVDAMVQIDIDILLIEDIHHIEDRLQEEIDIEVEMIMIVAINTLQDENDQDMMTDIMQTTTDHLINQNLMLIWLAGLFFYVLL